MRGDGPVQRAASVIRSFLGRWKKDDIPMAVAAFELHGDFGAAVHDAKSGMLVDGMTTPTAPTLLLSECELTPTVCAGEFHRLTFPLSSY